MIEVFDNIVEEHVAVLIDLHMKEILWKYDYSSVENFKNSYIQYLSKWNTKVPTHVLSHILEDKKLSIVSLRDAEKLILTNPNDIYVLGKYIEKQKKPREWLFVAEQAFFGSWNDLNR